MKETTSQHRIKELLDIFHITLSELSRTTGVQKSALSNYIHGTREPRQDKLSQIADAYGINPAWLMGYDVPMKARRKDAITGDVPIEQDADLIEKATRLYDLYQSADPRIRAAVDSLLKDVPLDSEHQD